MRRPLDPTPKLRGRYRRVRRWTRGGYSGPLLRAGIDHFEPPGSVTWPPLCLESNADLGPVLHVLQQVAAAPVLVENPVAEMDTPAWAPNNGPAIPAHTHVHEQAPAPSVPQSSGPAPFQTSSGPDEEPDELFGLVETVDPSELDLPPEFLK